MTLVRLLKQVAQVYQSNSMKRLLSLTKFSTHHHMERLILECARNNNIQTRIVKNLDVNVQLFIYFRSVLTTGLGLSTLARTSVRLRGLT